jgi:hypothetical protein
MSNMGQIDRGTSALVTLIMSSNINKPWVEGYVRAALEVDGQKMPERIVAAREAVVGRLKDLEGNSDHHAERHEMQSPEAETWGRIYASSSRLQATSPRAPRASSPRVAGREEGTTGVRFPRCRLLLSIVASVCPAKIDLPGIVS